MFLDRTAASERRFLAAALSLLLVVRLLLSPAMLPVAEDGRVPICAGGQIVYVAGDPDAAGGEEPRKDPCPYLGLAMAPPPAGASPAMPAVAALDDRWVRPAARVAIWRAVLRHPPRAPPQLSTATA